MMKIFFALTFFMSLNVWASDLHIPGLPNRCYAMGGTCISHVRGTNALFFNPAALARVEGFHLLLAQAQAGVSKDAKDFSTQFQGSTFSAADINNLYGKYLAADVSARGGFVIPNFGFGVYSNNYTTMQFSDPTYPTFEMNFISDYGYAIGGSIPLDANTSFGITARHIKRWGGLQDIDVSTIVGSSSTDLANNNFQDRGTGHAVDLAFMTTLSNHSLKPTFALVWQDVGVTTFNLSSGTKAPPSQQDNLIFGTSIQQDLGIMGLTHAFEYKFIRSGDSITKKLHLGTEASFGMLDLRAGLNQGYLTYGVGVDLWFFQVDASIHSTELGTYSGQSRNDNYNVSLTFELDFDQSFKLRDSQGKKRRLNQRR